jgi:hypothetical protein
VSRTTFLGPFFVLEIGGEPVSRFWWWVFVPISTALWVIVVFAYLTSHHEWVARSINSSASGVRGDAAGIVSMVDAVAFMAAYVGLGLLWFRLQLREARKGIGTLSWWIFAVLVFASLGASWTPISGINSITVRPVYFTLLALVAVGFQSVQCFTWASIVRSHIETRQPPPR